MEQINKLLILLTVLLIAAIIYIVVSSNNVAVSSNNVFSKTVLDMTQTTQKMMEKTMESIMENKNISIAPHPYNECIKLLIDQVNKENKQSDFDKMKTVCFGLLDKEKQLEK